ncbi:CopG family ribbon-helix-helix protein [Nitrososphaera viennensis]|uniref:Nickel-responsive regulator 1 n=2 Tax=Nitrososphaera viennensis TaxID=1034015 RepID=A0A977NLC2_9ARCH|nr:nickel-responsive regulator 1 [Nitrososphaera viennensis]UVS68297.1 nickel-responsive regulator 1 [Nitrososphaera viennensis]
MPVVSFSFNEGILAEMDRLQKSLGFPSRSEVVRAGIHNIIAEKRQPDNGQVRALLLVTHHEKFDEEVTKMRHRYEELVTTHLHNKIDGERCLEFFVLNGDAGKVREMRKRFAASKAMSNVRLVAL